MRKTLAVGVMLAALTVLVGSASANHSWNGYHWARTANPFTLQVGDNVTSQWDAYLDEAISDWSASNVLDLSKTSGQARGKNCRPTAGRIEVCNRAYGNTGWLGIASIWVTGGVHITQGTTRLNDTYFNTPQYDTPAWRRLVTCQEIAHDFGLDHQDENFNNPNLGTCMDYTNDPSTNQHPNAHDYEELDIIYAHLDGSGGGGGKPCNPHKPSCQPRASGALPFSQASRANGDVYVDELPGGGRRLTHVFWAPLNS
jgi:hypothetical protein